MNNISVNLYKEHFPEINSENAKITSPVTNEYNCIAWAAKENDIWWWPGGDESVYWPPGLSVEISVKNFAEAFATIGYVPCDDGSLVKGLEKVVLYVDEYNKPTHMARQTLDGEWTSKLGPANDISHQTPEVLNGPSYGEAKYYFSRPL